MKKWSLRTSLVLLLTFSTLTTFVLAGVGTLVFRLPQISAESRANAFREAQELSYLLEYYLSGIETQLQLASALTVGGPLLEKIPEEHLDAIIGDGKQLEAVYVIDENGSIEGIGLTPARRKARSISSAGDFSTNRLFRVAKESGQITWSDKYLSSITGGIAIGVAIPSGKHMIIGEIAPQVLTDTIRTIGQRNPHSILVVDSRGEWIADNLLGGGRHFDNRAGHPAVQAALSNRDTPEKSEFLGLTQHVGYAVSSHLKWAFLIGIPAGMDNPAFRATVFLVVGTCTASLLIGLFLAVFYATQVTRPLRHLLDRTHQLANGNFGATHIESSIVELDMLAGDMEGMARAIQERQKNVEDAARQLENSERELIAIFNASPVAMLVADPDRDYSFVAVNEVWTRQFGRTREEVIGLNGSQFGFWQSNEDRQRFLAEQERVGKVDGQELWMRRADGSQLLCRISGRLIDTGGQRFVIMVLEDITERRLIEQEIRELNTELEERVRRRTEDLQQANLELGKTLEHLTTTQEELVRSEKLAALGRLVAGVAHELNTPIGNGLMAATTFRDQFREFRERLSIGLKRSDLNGFLTTAETASDIIVRNLERGAGLINSFKRLAVDQTSAQCRLFILSETVNEVLTILHPTLKRTPYIVETDIPSNIELENEPGALEQVLTNLINNAVLHGFEGRDHGLIRISASIANDNWVHIIFSDDGKGMNDEILSHIFDPFFTTKFGQGGSGLGLHIVHNAVTGILGGSIKVESSPDHGTRFDIFIPVVCQKLSRAGESPRLP